MLFPVRSAISGTRKDSWGKKRTTIGTITESDALIMTAAGLLDSLCTRSEGFNCEGKTVGKGYQSQQLDNFSFVFGFRIGMFGFFFVNAESLFLYLDFFLSRLFIAAAMLSFGK